MANETNDRIIEADINAQRGLVHIDVCVDIGSIRD